MQDRLRRFSNVWILTGFQVAQTRCAEGSKYFMVFILSVLTWSQALWVSKTHRCVTNQTPVVTHLEESPDWAHPMTSPIGFNELSVRAQDCKPHSSSQLSSVSLKMWNNSSHSSPAVQVSRSAQVIFLTCIFCQLRKARWRTTPHHPLSVSQNNSSREGNEESRPNWDGTVANSLSLP